MLLENLIPCVLHKLAVYDNSQVICIACELELVWLVVLSIEVGVFVATGYHSDGECVVLAQLLLLWTLSNIALIS